MPRNLRSALCVCALAVAAAACSSTRETDFQPVAPPPSVGVYKVGKPYQIAGTWYYPREQPDYDETGIASWYGPTFYGKRTANGEIFDAHALSAAHRTLPMPVNVRVTNLENGRSLVVRVNDRGPYAKSRIIDLSEEAAKLLGYFGKGTARVRVTYVGRADLDPALPARDAAPPQIANALPAAPSGTVDVGPIGAAEPQAAPQRQASLIAPPLPPADQVNGKVEKVPVPAVTHIYVQAGAFASQDNAERLKRRLSSGGELKISSIDIKGKRIYRVRLGPFDDVAQADAALDRLTQAGSTDAAIVVDR